MTKNSNLLTFNVSRALNDYLIRNAKKSSISIHKGMKIMQLKPFLYDVCAVVETKLLQQ